MKKYIIITLVGLVLVSCSNGGDDPSPTTEPEKTENEAPTAPVLATPTNNQLCIDNNLEFTWGASTDPEGDGIKYTVEVSKNIEFSQITHSFPNLTGTTKTILLDRDVVYYWRAKATDNKNASSAFSSIFQFYTEGTGEENHLPFASTVLQPSLNEVISGSSVSLRWAAADVDNDILTFDVYLDINNPPTAIAVSDHTDKEYVISSLVTATTYYWKVDTKDNHGAVAVGQVWSFTTE